MSEPFAKIELLPDTGFHIAFLPLFLDAAEAFDDEEAWFARTYTPPELAGEVKDKIRHWADRKGWIQSKDKRWLRLRFAKVRMQTDVGTKVPVYGIKLGVETNLGKVTDGFDMGQKPVPRPLRNDPGLIAEGYNPSTPYVARTAEELATESSMLIDLVKEFELDSEEHLGGVTPSDFRGGPDFDYDDDPDFLYDDEEPRSSSGSDMDSSAVAGSALTVKLNWIEEGGAKPRKVDLIVDFGNSRTAVLGLEDNREVGVLFNTVCKPIVFTEAGNLYEETEYSRPNLNEVLPDSWFVLQQNQFHGIDEGPDVLETVIETRKTMLGREVDEAATQIHRKPYMFRTLSPAVFGNEAREILEKRNLRAGGRSFLSSPKRYIWDLRPVGQGEGTAWTMEPAEWVRPEIGDDMRLIRLSGEILTYLPPDTFDQDAEKPSERIKVWDEENAPYLLRIGQGAPRFQKFPNHPKAAGLVWTALTILETAHQQINSDGWRAGSDPTLRRVLDKIILTCPAGWTEEEIHAFVALWRLARQIFYYSRKRKDPKPVVELAMDEAVASQLPFVYSELTHLRGRGSRWVNLFGRDRGGERSVRVLTIDIGGGTTDTSVVEYANRSEDGQARLKTKLVFRQSSTIAGDKLVKDVIERILLPNLIPENAPQRQIQEFTRVFSEQPDSLEEQQARLILIRLVLLPIVIQWLKDLSDGVFRDPETFRFREPNQQIGVEVDSLNRFNEILRRKSLEDFRIDPGRPLEVDFDRLRQVVEEWFEPLAEAHTHYVAAFGCDLVVLTGKPSEQSVIRDILEQRLPIFPERIISAKGYFAGEWAPSTDSGKIRDAKLVTVLGSAVKAAINNKKITNVTLEQPAVGRVYQNHWAVWNRGDSRLFEEDAFLPRGVNEKRRILNMGTFIGKAMFFMHSRPEQVYQITWIGPEKNHPDTVRVTLERHSPEMPRGVKVDVDEGLRLKKAEIQDRKGEWVDTPFVRLMLCTLPDGGDHWLDSGIFEMDLE